jgi:hypothetical protein
LRVGEPSGGIITAPNRLLLKSIGSPYPQLIPGQLVQLVGCHNALLLLILSARILTLPELYREILVMQSVVYGTDVSKLVGAITT